MRLPPRNVICDAMVQDAIAQGEFRHAAEQLIRGYQDAVVRCCTDYLGSEGDGQEVAQAIFLGAYTAMARFRGHASVYTWLCSIFKKQCYQALRDRIRESDLLMEHAPTIADALHREPPPRVGEDLDGLLQRVVECLNTLDKAEAALLRMRYLVEIPVADMAKILGLSKRTVERQLAQALRHLRTVVNHEA